MKAPIFTLSALTVITFSLYAFRPATSVPGPAPAAAPATVSTPMPQDAALTKSIEAGKTVFTTYCQMCHQATGQGIPNVYPPLAKSDYLMADSKRAIDHIKNGKQGEITVNGKKYNQVMPAQPLNDQQVMDVMNYIRNSWGNKGKIVTLAEVKAVKKK